MDLNEIYNMDCVDGMKMINDNSIDLVITSPPYDNLREYDGIGESWNFEKFKNVANEISRILKKGAIAVWNVQDQSVNGSESLTSFKQAIYFKEVAGLNLYDTMIWEKPPRGACGSNRGYWQSFEYMFVFCKGEPKTINLIKDRKNKESREGDVGTKRQKNGYLKKVSRAGYSEYGRRTNVWTYGIGKNIGTKDDVSWHPATFPEMLAVDHIRSWTNEGDLVLDPFIGSGTTAIACNELKRNYIGFEMNESYFKKAKTRITERNSQISLF